MASTSQKFSLKCPEYVTPECNIVILESELSLMDPSEETPGEGGFDPTIITED